MPRTGHPSAGSFGWNVTQETHNGAYCMFCRDDCCLLALWGTEETDTGRSGGRDDDDDYDDDDDECRKNNHLLSNKKEAER